MAIARLPQVGATPQWMLSTRISGLKTSANPSSTSSTWVAKSTTAKLIESFAASCTPTVLSATSTTMTIAPPNDVPRVRVQGLPEDREVMRHEERRRGDRHDVDEHLRPRCAEAHELVERVAGEARRAAGLGKADRSLRVRRRGGREDDPGEDEDERRQPKGENRGEPERVVDRGTDIAVRRGEQGGCAQHPLHADFTAAPRAGHGRECTPVRGQQGRWLTCR